MDNGVIDPATLQAILESIGEGEEDVISRQYDMASGLRGRAMSGAPTTALGIPTQALQGYMAGSQMKNANEAVRGLGAQRAAGRNRYFDALMAARGGGGSPGGMFADPNAGGNLVIGQ